MLDEKQIKGKQVSLKKGIYKTAFFELFYL